MSSAFLPWQEIHARLDPSTCSFHAAFPSLVRVYVVRTRLLQTDPHVPVDLPWNEAEPRILFVFVFLLHRGWIGRGSGLVLF